MTSSVVLWVASTWRGPVISSSGSCPLGSRAHGPCCGSRTSPWNSPSHFAWTSTSWGSSPSEPGQSGSWTAIRPPTSSFILLFSSLLETPQAIPISSFSLGTKFPSKLTSGTPILCSTRFSEICLSLHLCPSGALTVHRKASNLNVFSFIFY